MLFQIPTLPLFAVYKLQSGKFINEVVKCFRKIFNYVCIRIKNGGAARHAEPWLTKVRSIIPFWLQHRNDVTRTNRADHLTFPSCSVICWPFRAAASYVRTTVEKYERSLDDGASLCWERVEYLRAFQPTSERWHCMLGPRVTATLGMTIIRARRVQLQVTSVLSVGARVLPLHGFLQHEQLCEWYVYDFKCLKMMSPGWCPWRPALLHCRFRSTRMLGFQTTVIKYRLNIAFKYLGINMPDASWSSKNYNRAASFSF